jgi:succinoglycan biosynthesis transport protein ExoP
MSLELFLSALRARLGAAATVLVATVLAAAALSLALPKSYRAGAALLVDATREEQSLSNVLLPPRERVGYLQTQMDILGSERVALKVVRDLKLAERPAQREAHERAGGAEAGAFEPWQADALLRRLKVEASQSNVIRLSFSSSDPHYAAEVVNGFARAYIDTMLELRVEPTRQAALWFDEQLKGLRANFEAAQARLTQYHRQQGIVSADERLDVENTRLTELSTQLVKAQEQVIELRARERLPDAPAGARVQALQADLARAEAKRQELSPQYGARHPLVLRQDAELGSLRAQLREALAEARAGVALSRRQSEQRAAQLGAALAAQRARLLELKEGRNELAVLMRDVESAQRTYETAMQRAVVSQVESRASQTNVALLSPAVAPRKPTHPRLALNLALALVLGALLGAGLAILLEMLDRRVHAPIDLQSGMDVPLLGLLNAWRPAAAGLLVRGPR